MRDLVVCVVLAGSAKSFVYVAAARSRSHVLSARLRARLVRQAFAAYERAVESDARQWRGLSPSVRVESVVAMDAAFGCGEVVF